MNSHFAFAQNASVNPSPLIPGSLAEQQYFQAIRQNNAATVRKRLLSVMHVNAMDSQFPHNSALHWAAWEGATDIIDLLLKEKDVQVDLLNSVDETPLMIAALKGNLPMMRQFIAAGAYPNKEGWTPLHYAATVGNVDAMRLLLEENAYIDAESPNKTTPLMLAAQSKNILAVKLLLDEGADYEAKNDAGWDVITFAEKANSNDIVEGLKLRQAALKARQSKPAWLK